MINRTAPGIFSSGINNRSKTRRPGEGRIRPRRQIINQQDWYRPSAGKVPSERELSVVVVRNQHRAERTARRERPRPLTESVDVVGEIAVHDRADEEDSSLSDASGVLSGF